MMGESRGVSSATDRGIVLEGKWRWKDSWGFVMKEVLVVG
jgi:hypothetical protein